MDFYPSIVYSERKRIVAAQRGEVMANNLQQLHQLGQSPWYDNISRDLLNNGEIQGLVDLGIRGMTSNPSIFKSAITSGSAYDQQIEALLKEGKSSQEI